MPKKIDLTNQHIGEWTIIREATIEEKKNKPGAFWLCKCSCGNEKIVNGQSLRNGESKSCGCKTKEYITQKNIRKAQDMTGEKYGNLTVLYRDFEYEKKFTTRGQTYWRCKCDCGNEKTVGRSMLKTGRTKSCGCLRKQVSAQRLREMSKNNFIDETDNRYGKLTVLYKMENNHNTRQGALWHCKCDCGKEINVFGIDLRNGTTSSCGCLTISKGELKIQQLLTDNNVLFIKEYPIKVDKKILRFDFAILDNQNNIKYIIEYDGKQHFNATEYFGGEEQLKITQQNDIIKNNWCNKNNIPLIRIPYTKYNNLTIQDLIL